MKELLQGVFDPDARIRHEIKLDDKQFKLLLAAILRAGANSGGWGTSLGEQLSEVENMYE